MYKSLLAQAIRRHTPHRATIGRGGAFCKFLVGKSGGITIMIVPAIVNHAHNDILELAMELGLVGILLVLCWLAATLIAALRNFRESDATLRKERFAALIVVGLLFAHSTIDYPMRTSALAAVFAMCCAVICKKSSRAARRDEHVIFRDDLEPVDGRARRENFIIIDRPQSEAVSQWGGSAHLSRSKCSFASPPPRESIAPRMARDRRLRSAQRPAQEPLALQEALCPL